MSHLDYKEEVLDIKEKLIKSILLMSANEDNEMLKLSLEVLSEDELKTLNVAKHLKKPVLEVEKEKWITSSILNQSEQHRQLKEGCEELEKRKQRLMEQVGELERGEINQVIQEIELVRNEIADLYNIATIKLSK